eukprot:CAMPEP_0181083064 /NCGR_PEP_ID=MMETSP1071-20121207/3960_1 /TAXON_ID=35127 /ORGANISM="Thalassiosira sp., Strain NH16" /LENGTH=71 /DNA_ID=CAMNT_0023164701 /DNA_START=60 /DNA_END=272 /DNA_ORIENTATION=+
MMQGRGAMATALLSVRCHRTHTGPLQRRCRAICSTTSSLWHGCSSSTAPTTLSHLHYNVRDSTNCARSSSH